MWPKARDKLVLYIDPLYRQASKPIHLLMTILGFGNSVM